MDFEQYKSEVSTDIKKVISTMGVQPILFVGSGLSKRYFNGPSWENLLVEMANICPSLDKEFAYYKQNYASLIDVGSSFSEAFREWAWSKGRNLFPDDLFDASQPTSVYLKYSACEYIKSLINPNTWIPDESHVDEIAALKAIRPHAIITTNYDQLLEYIFPDYEPIIGQCILHANYSSVGEILKIHGCVTKTGSIVLTRADYDEFIAKKKYLSAKLLTFFSEHPLIFIGYSASDPNIQAILSDIDEILSPSGELIENIFLLQRKVDAETSPYMPRESLIDVGSSQAVRVKQICASSFTWVFDAFQADSSLEAVNPKLLRALMARTFKLIRHDIPTKTVEVDYEKLEHALKHDSDFAKLYGITTLDDPTAINAIYPYSLTQVGQELGYTSWHKADALIKQIGEKNSFFLKQSDNRYHLAFMVGTKSQTHKYSEATIDLLRKVDKGEVYSIEG